ncbi:bifunctional nuclease family protein [Collinsella intestinalis]|uniref:Bifunctional nuclease family protein n=1 Tax=Collinsella intestinalis TaxID=147207 RepID=A0A414FVG8_9ACTN|nr:bifunctional nuclease family protein [Collinsella intestinalis]RHD55094.1 bifunctional nuclease family protein [Collinsella intestinalis]
MIRVDIESIVMAAGPVPSVVVLRERKGGAGSGAPLRALSIQTGAYEAAAIGGGMDSDKAAPRPIAHDVMLRTVQELGAKIERVEINRWEAPVFYADVVLDRGDGAGCRDSHENGEGRDIDGDAAESGAREIKIDARPSDALALAARSNAPIYVEDEVMNRAGSISLQSDTDPDSAKEELERFDEFVQGLSPDDF